MYRSQKEMLIFYTYGAHILKTSNLIFMVVEIYYVLNNFLLIINISGFNW